MQGRICELPAPRDLAAFALWTAAVILIDVRPIGPNGSAVGFAALNQWFHDLTGVHMTLYTITDWLGLGPLGTALGFAVLGLTQWVRRRRLRRVDSSPLILGGLYLAVLAAYGLFEAWATNDRPIFDQRVSGGLLSLLHHAAGAVCAANGHDAAQRPLTGSPLRRRANGALAGFTAFMVVGRLLAGVHWLTDILGGALLSAGLGALYAALVRPLSGSGDR